MRNLKPPVFKVKEVLEKATSGIQDKAKREKLQALARTLHDSETRYRGKARRAELYSVSESDTIPVTLANGQAQVVSNSEMIDLYKTKLLKGTARGYYDQLKIEADEICPFCGERTVNSMDHYLAKQKPHSLYVITPINLVPSCTDCNNAKNKYQMNAKEEQPLHPYFDQLGDSEWLKAVVPCTRSLKIQFSVEPAIHWSDSLKLRVQNQFDLLELARLYRIYSARMLNNLAEVIKKASEAHGVEGVRFQLRAQLSGHEGFDRNCWQAALLRGLIASTWFCETGYKYIPQHRMAGRT